MMTTDEQILDVLRQILETEQKALANQEQAIAQQQLAIQRQAAHLRLYRITLIVFIPILGYVVYYLATLPNPHSIPHL